MLAIMRYLDTHRGWHRISLDTEEGRLVLKLVEWGYVRQFSTNYFRITEGGYVP